MAEGLSLESFDYLAEIAAIATEPAVIEFDSTGTIIRASDAFLSLMGYEGEEIQGQKHAIFVDDAYRRSLDYELFWRELLQGHHRAARLRRIGKNGKEVWIEASYNPVFDEAGRFLKVVKYATDITEAELQAADVRGQLEAISRAQAVVEYDLRGYVLRANDNFLNIVGYSSHEVTGGPHSMFLDADDADIETYEGFWGALAGGQHCADRFRLLAKGGREVWLQASFNPILGPSGVPLKIVAYAMDVTRSVRQINVANALLEHKVEERTAALEAALLERKRMEAELVQAQKLEAVGQLAAGVAHEINTPMQYISDNTHFLRRAILGLSNTVARLEELAEEHPELARTISSIFRREKVQQLVRQIPSALDETIEGVEVVTRIIGALKEFSHPGSNRKNLENINKALDTTIVVSKNEWKYVASVQAELDHDLPAVPCLRGELNQVFLNLIVNAAHAIQDRKAGGDDSPGVIRVETRRRGGDVEVRIGDNGCGIPGEIRHRIFEPFFTTKEVGRGSGQGLGIARSIICEKHGGKLTFETIVGQGTTFVIRLPLHESNPPPESTDRKQSA